MRRILLLVLVIASAAAAFSGGDVRLRLLSPVTDPYRDDYWDEQIERGVQFGISACYDFGLPPGLSAGPRFNVLFYNDTAEDDQGSDHYDYNFDWSEVMIGGGLRYRFLTSGALRPWIGFEVGFGWLNLAYSAEWTMGEIDGHVDVNAQGGGLALEINAGTEWWFQPNLGMTFSLDYHYLGVDKLEWEDDDWGEWDMDELPQSIGLGVGICYTF